MNFHSITTIARQELTVNIRNRWTLIFAGVFSVLVLAISYFGLATAGAIGFQGFARTSASLLNLVLYVIPLVALTMGTGHFPRTPAGCGRVRSWRYTARQTT